MEVISWCGTAVLSIRPRVHEEGRAGGRCSSCSPSRWGTACGRPQRSILTKLCICVHCQARPIWSCQGGGWCQHRPARSATRLVPRHSLEDKISPPTRTSLSQPYMTRHSMKISDKDFKISKILAKLYTFWSHWRTGTFNWVVGSADMLQTVVLQRQLR